MEAARKSVYDDLRCNMPVVEVIPSLDPRHAFEAHAWVVPHPGVPPDKRDRPVEVIWSAGPKFKKMAHCKAEINPRFEAIFAYFGPMLLQARITFKDGSIAVGHVYAWMP